MTWELGETGGRALPFPPNQARREGSWCWFNDPRVYYLDGTARNLYVGWVDLAGDVGISRTDLDSGQQTHFVLAAALNADDHANPAITLLPDGRLRVFYCAHNDNNIYFRTSAAPESIAAFDAAQQVFAADIVGGQGMSYPKPHVVSALPNRTWLLFRATSWLAGYSYSDDDGATWAPIVDLIGVATGGARPYVRTLDDGADKIHLLFTDGHPAAVPTNNLYHAYIQPSTETLHKSDGTLIGPIDTLYAPTVGTKVYDAATAGRAWHWDMAFGDDGHLRILFTAHPSPTDHRYRHARWTGAAWVTNEIVAGGGSIANDAQGTEPYYSGGVAFDRTDPDTVFVSRPVSGQWEIDRYVTTDDGATWAGSPITRGSTAKQVRPVGVYGDLSGPDVPRVVWMDGIYNYWTPSLGELTIPAPAFRTRLRTFPALSL